MHKSTCLVFPLQEMLRKSKFTETEKRRVIDRPWIGKETKRVTANGHVINRIS